MLSFLDALASILDEADRSFVILDRLRISGRVMELIDTPEQPGLRIARVGEAIGRFRDFIRPYRFNDVGGHNDHEFGFMPLVIVRAKQRADNRQGEEAWKTIDDLLRFGLDKPRGGDGAAGRDLDRRLILTGEKCGDGEASERRSRLGVIYVSHFRSKGRLDAALCQNYGGEPQRDTIILVEDGDGAKAAYRAARRAGN